MKVKPNVATGGKRDVPAKGGTQPYRLEQVRTLQVLAENTFFHCEDRKKADNVDG